MLNHSKLNELYEMCAGNANGLLFDGELVNQDFGVTIKLADSRRMMEDKPFLQNILLNTPDEAVRHGIKIYYKSLGPLYLIQRKKKVVGIINVLVLEENLMLWVEKDSNLISSQEFLCVLDSYLSAVEGIYRNHGSSLRIHYLKGDTETYVYGLSDKYMIVNDSIYLNVRTRSDLNDADLVEDYIANQYGRFETGDLYLLRRGDASPFGFDNCSLWHMMSSGERMDQLIEGMKKYRKEHYKD